MATEFLLTEDDASNIAVFCRIAKANGASLSLGEVIQLASLDVSEEELERAWLLDSNLSSDYEIDEQIIYERECEHRSEVSVEQNDRRRRADSNISYARKFVSGLHTKDALVVSISGSTSYQSVSRSDDLDFFCITKRDTMWLFLCKALIRARLFRLKDKNSPWLCLSYVMDEKYATTEFTTPQDGLFARDAISTIVVQGEDNYTSLLRRCGWIEQYFQKMYRLRTVGQENCEDRREITSSNFLSRALNSVLYLSAGSYIRFKSYLLNRRFARKKENSRIFNLRIGPDHCIFESRSYLELREMYSRLEKVERSDQL